MFQQLVYITSLKPRFTKLSGLAESRAKAHEKSAQLFQQVHVLGEELRMREENLHKIVGRLTGEKGNGDADSVNPSGVAAATTQEAPSQSTPAGQAEPEFAEAVISNPPLFKRFLLRQFDLI